MRNPAFARLPCAVATVSLLTATTLATTARSSTPAESPAAPKSASPEQAALVSGNTRFALALYAKLRDRNGNLFLSPYSISSALAMTTAGARGETARQMKQALGLTLGDTELHAAFKAVTAALNEGGTKGNYEFSVANALWPREGHGFLDPFLAIAKGSYGAGVQPLDFTDSEDARRIINAWVEKETRDRIKDLIKPGMLDGSTGLVLTNAIYFKGLWRTKFKKENTRDDTFHTGAGTVQVPMMRQKEAFGFFENEQLQVLELPYKGEEVSMLVLLPKQNDGLPALERSLTVEDLDRYTAALSKQTVDVTLPKWKVTSEFSLGGMLQSLGMKDAFTDGKADFSGMDGTKSLVLSEAIHKAFVDVNEEGTEAAAATGVIVHVTSVVVVPRFLADHPFLYMIRDKRTGSVLFLGRLTDPKA